MLKSESKLDMTFASFFEIYEADKKKRVKENTWESKSHIIRTKILPYFGNCKIAEIEPKDVIAWQSRLLEYQGENGEVYSPTYLKTIHSQLTNQHGKLQDEVEKLLTDKKSVELALATAKDEMETMQAETGVVRAERDRVIEETEEAKRQVTSHLKTAENLYYKYSSVAVTDRQAEFFDEIVKTRYEKEKLEYENQKLQSENNMLRQILDKVEGFMRELKINGRNLWDAFKERIADILPGNGEEHLHRR